MSSAPIVVPPGQDDDSYIEGCYEQWRREDEVLNGVTATRGRPRSQRIKARRRAQVVSPRYWERNADAENPRAHTETRRYR